MSPQELRAAVSLASIFGLRMFGMFVILPVFAIYAEGLPGGDDLTMVGIAIGVYGLTQALLQQPVGRLSDRWGRKPVMLAGLAVFTLGGAVAALAPDMGWLIAGRALQGCVDAVLGAAGAEPPSNSSSSPLPRAPTPTLS